MNFQLGTLVACNVENDSGLSYRNEAGRPPPNLPLVRGRDFQLYRFQCYSPLAAQATDSQRAAGAVVPVTGLLLVQCVERQHVGHELSSLNWHRGRCHPARRADHADRLSGPRKHVMI